MRDSRNPLFWINSNGSDESHIPAQNIFGLAISIGQPGVADGRETTPRHDECLRVIFAGVANLSICVKELRLWIGRPIAARILFHLTISARVHSKALGLMGLGKLLGPLPGRFILGDAQPKAKPGFRSQPYEPSDHILIYPPCFRLIGSPRRDCCAGIPRC